MIPILESRIREKKLIPSDPKRQQMLNKKNIQKVMKNLKNEIRDRPNFLSTNKT